MADDAYIATVKIRGGVVGADIHAEQGKQTT